MTTMEQETNDIIVKLSYAELEQVVQDHETVIKNAAIMLGKQKKIIEDLKKHLEFNLKILADIEIENMKLKDAQ